MAGIDPSKYQDYVQGKISYEQAQSGYKAPTTPASNTGTSVLRDAYDSRSNTSSPVGIANSAPSAVVQKATNNSTTGLPSWMGNSYSQVPGTGWYSTNPSNPNASKYDASGNPVASLGYSNQQTGTKFDGYGTTDQFNQLKNAAQSGQNTSGLYEQWIKNGQLTSNDSIYKNASAPKTSLSSVYAPPPPAQSGTMTATSSGYTKNPTVDAMPIDQQIAYYKANPTEAQKEISRAEGIGSAGAMSWANQLKSSLSSVPGSQQSAQAYINDQTSGQGGLSNYVAMQQVKWDQAQAQGDTDMIARLNADMARVGYKLNTTDSTGTGTNGIGIGIGTGTGAGKPTAADLIKSIYDANYSSQSQKLKSARDQALAGLAGQENIIGQTASSGLNNNDLMATQRTQALKEAMANMGLSSSGDSISAQIGIGTSQQQGANDINTNKGNQLTQLSAQRNAISNNSNADDLALMQSLQAAQSSQLLTDLYNQRNFDYTASQDSIKNGQWDKMFGYNAGQDAIKNSQWDKTFNYNVTQDEIKNGQWSKQFDAQMEQWAAGNQLDWTKMNLEAKQAAAQIAISQQNANTSAYNASTSAYNASRSASNDNQNALYRQWEATGVAPAGIPGVATGTPLYDKTGARQDQQAQNKQEQLDAKSFTSERDGMVSAIRSNKVTVNDAMNQINQDEKMGVYTADLAEKLRAVVRVLGGSTKITADPQNNIQLDLGSIYKPSSGGTSVTQSVFGR